MSEWPGGQVGGETERKSFPVPEPRITDDGLYKCPACNQLFETRQYYTDHYVSTHTSARVEKNYPL